MLHSFSHLFYYYYLLLFVNKDAQIFNQNHHVAGFRLSSLPLQQPQQKLTTQCSRPTLKLGSNVLVSSLRIHRQRPQGARSPTCSARYSPTDGTPELWLAPLTSRPSVFPSPVSLMLCTPPSHRVPARCCKDAPRHLQQTAWMQFIIDYSGSV